MSSQSEEQTDSRSCTPEEQNKEEMKQQQQLAGSIEHGSADSSRGEQTGASFGTSETRTTASIEAIPLDDRVTGSSMLERDAGPPKSQLSKVSFVPNGTNSGVGFDANVAGSDGTAGAGANVAGDRDCAEFGVNVATAYEDREALGVGVNVAGDRDESGTGCGNVADPVEARVQDRQADLDHLQSKWRGEDYGWRVAVNRMGRKIGSRLVTDYQLKGDPRRARADSFSNRGGLKDYCKAVRHTRTTNRFIKFDWICQCGQRNYENSRKCKTCRKFKSDCFKETVEIDIKQKPKPNNPPVTDNKDKEKTPVVVVEAPRNH